MASSSGRSRRGAGGRLLILAALAAALLVAVAFAARVRRGDDGATTQTGGDTEVLRLASWMTLSTWDPRASSGDEPLFLANVYEPLLYVNPPGSAEPYTPCLATSWSVSDDGLTWTFKLREGVTFHDGTPFTSAAVKSTDRVDARPRPGRRLHVVSGREDHHARRLHGQAQDQLSGRPRPRATAMYGAWMFSPKAADKSTKWWDDAERGRDRALDARVVRAQRRDRLRAQPGLLGRLEGRPVPEGGHQVRRRVGHAASDARGRRGRLRRRPRPRQHPVDARATPTSR